MNALMDSRKSMRSNVKIRMSVRPGFQMTVVPMPRVPIPRVPTLAPAIRAIRDPAMEPRVVHVSIFIFVYILRPKHMKNLRADNAFMT